MKTFFRSRLWDVCWLGAGILAILISTIVNFSGFSILLFTSFIGSILGLIIVQSMANLKGRFGSILGVIGAGFDCYNNFNFGIMSQALLVIYTGLTYIFGFFTLGRKISVKRTNSLDILVSFLVAVLGLVILSFFGLSILPPKAPSWIFYLSCFCFLIQVVAQYLMITGKVFSWYIWVVANIINIIIYASLYFLHLEPMAVFYMILTFMYLLNSIKAIFVWSPSGAERH
ncbi:MAG: nicotinamide mononucleotide transporter family protein [Bifidobacteriaceae bacterium]|jgi:nicotinamide mononucleotide transporter PnuC|nr:nicotinamide mononucleotide transporter family protein [Bifidobacteriaceae bacterium]